MESEVHDWSPHRRESDSLSVYLLGVVDYRSAVAVQESLLAGFADRRDRAGALVLCEHPPTVTIGRDGSVVDLPADPRVLESRLIDVHRVARGGLTLMHAPGQLAVYPIVPLDRLRMDTVAFSARLQQAALAVCREQKVTAAESEVSDSAGANRFGVTTRCGQVGFCGVTKVQGISLHGYFLNVRPDLHLLRLIRSGNRKVGSMVAQIARPIAMQTVRTGFIRHLTAALGYNDFHVFSSHPLLARTRRQTYDLTAYT